MRIPIPQRRRRDRTGATAVEFAISAPLLFFIFFTSLEFARVNMLRQSVENAAYEGSRRGIVPGATADDCRASAQAILDAVFAVDSQITVTPAVITDDIDDVTVAITVPLDSNCWVVPLFFDGMSISGSMTLRQERFSNPNTVE